MHSPKHQNHRKRRTDRPARPNRAMWNDRTGKAANYRELAQPESTGKESSYLKSLIDSRTPVTVTMINGDQFHGHIRYYDRDCFSIGLSSEKRKIFLRKDSVSCITEE
jgi:RNA chaperone Hfq